MKELSEPSSCLSCINMQRKNEIKAIINVSPGTKDLTNTTKKAMEINIHLKSFALSAVKMSLFLTVYIDMQ